MKATSFLGKLVNNKAISKFTILIFLTEFVRGAFLTFIPLYAGYVLKYSIDTVGAVVCAYFFMETLSQIFVGRLLDKHNNRLVLLIGLSLSLCSLIMMKFCVSPILLIIEGGIFGLGFSPVWIIILGYISKFKEEKRAVSMGVIYSAWLCATGLGGVLVSFIIGRGYNFALLTLIALWSICLIMGALITEGIRRKEEPIDFSTSDAFQLSFKEIKEKKFLIPGMLLQTFGITILLPIFPIYLTHSKYVNLSTDQYGIALTFIGIVTVVCMILFGSLTKKIGILNLFIGGLIASAISILGIGNFKNIYVILFFGIIFAISYSATLPAWNGILANNIRPEIRGLMWGCFSTIEGFGRSIGSLTGGVLGQNYNLHFSFNLSAITLFTLSIIYVIFIRKKILN